METSLCVPMEIQQFVLMVRKPHHVLMEANQLVLIPACQPVKMVCFHQHMVGLPYHQHKLLN